MAITQDVSCACMNWLLAKSQEAGGIEIIWIALCRTGCLDRSGRTVLQSRRFRERAPSGTDLKAGDVRIHEFQRHLLVKILQDARQTDLPEMIYDSNTEH